MVGSILSAVSRGNRVILGLIHILSKYKKEQCWLDSHLSLIWVRYLVEQCWLKHISSQYKVDHCWLDSHLSFIRLYYWVEQCWLKQISSKYKVDQCWLDNHLSLIRVYYTANFLTAKNAGFHCVHNPTALSLQFLQSIKTGSEPLHFDQVQLFYCNFYHFSTAISTIFPLQLLLLFHCNLYYFSPVIFYCFSTAFFATFSISKMAVNTAF